MTPFKEKSEMLIFDKILNEDLHFSHKTPSIAQDLILRLLERIPEKRIGYSNFEDLKSHPFFKGIDFDNLDIILPPNESIIQVLTTSITLKKTMSHSKLNILSKELNNLIINDNNMDFEKENILQNNDLLKNKKLDHKNTMNTYKSKINEYDQIKLQIRKSTLKRNSKLEKNSKNLTKINEETLVLECKFNKSLF